MAYFLEIITAILLGILGTILLMGKDRFLNVVHNIWSTVFTLFISLRSKINILRGNTNSPNPESKDGTADDTTNSEISIDDTIDFESTSLLNEDINDLIQTKL